MLTVRVVRRVPVATTNQQNHHISFGRSLWQSIQGSGSVREKDTSHTELKRCEKVDFIVCLCFFLLASQLQGLNGQMQCCLSSSEGLREGFFHPSLGRHSDTSKPSQQDSPTQASDILQGLHARRQEVV